MVNKHPRRNHIMRTITLELPDVILESYEEDMDVIKKEMNRGFVIWEYLNGHLSIAECGNILGIGYRGFLELLWSNGIPVDGLNEAELDEQVSFLRTVNER
jgi:predicted HTH domain antitoxin